MATKFITGPDGKLRTTTDYDAVTPEQLETLRRHVKDMIAGNIKFHSDPYTEYETYYQFGIFEDEIMC